MYIQHNEPEGIRNDHQLYLRKIARIGLGDQYPGANWVAHSWYARNLKIFVNLTRITESVDDRHSIDYRCWASLPRAAIP